MSEQMSQWVRALRHRLSMTQEEFAHELGITVGTVNRWENGRFRPSKLARATLADFATKRGLSLDDTGTPAATDDSAVHRSYS